MTEEETEEVLIVSSVLLAFLLLILMFAVVVHKHNEINTTKQTAQYSIIQTNEAKK